MVEDVSYGYCHCGCGQKTNMAPQTDRRIGWVKGEPIRYIKGHHGRRDLAEKFWSKIEVRDEDECWEWKASTRTGGYGAFRGEDGLVGAHRIAWEIANGERVPDDLVVRHKCDNRLCCNPAHLELGTHADNSRDMVERERSARGSRSGRSVLTEEDVLEVRRLLSRGEKISSIARNYGVAYNTIWEISIGTHWGWLGGGEDEV
jgi:hypothetical protein